MSQSVKMQRREAWFTFDERAAADGVGNLYYFAIANRADPPYLTQRRVEAIIDIGDDGTLAGVELIDNMPRPPALSPPVTTPAESGGGEIREWEVLCGDGTWMLVTDRDGKQYHIDEHKRAGIPPPVFRPLYASPSPVVSDVLSAQPAVQDEEYVPKLIHFDGEGDPYWQFVERDTATITGQVFAANVEMLTDFDGNVIGFTIYDRPASIEETKPEPVAFDGNALFASPSSVPEVTAERVELVARWLCDREGFQPDYLDDSFAAEPNWKAFSEDAEELLTSLRAAAVGEK